MKKEIKKQKEQTENEILLIDYLENLNKEEIDKLYDEKVKINKNKKAHRKEKIEEIYISILFEISITFNIVGIDKFKEVKDVMNNIQPKEVDPILLDTFILVKIDDKYQMFKEIKDMYNNFSKKEFTDEKKQVMFSHYITSNGMLKEEKVIELMQESGISINKKEINQYIKKYQFVKKDGFIYSNELIKELNKDNKLYELKENLEYKIFIYEEVLIYLLDTANENYPEKINKIIRKYIKNEDELNEISAFMINRITVGAEYEETIEKILLELNINLTNKEKEKLYNILEEVHLNMPSVTLNGYTPLEFYEELDDYGSFEVLTEEEKIEVYINAYVILNGIIKVDKLLKIINEEHNIKITKNKLIKEISKIEELKIHKDYLMGKENEEEEFQYLLSIKKQDKYYVIEDIDEMYNELEEIEYSIKDILKKNNLPEKISDEIIALLNVKKFNEDILYCILEDKNIRMPLKKMNQLYQSIKILTNNYRVWYLNGFKINETNQIIKKEKIGRNDLCHCGSGKKYKRCCGK